MVTAVALAWPALTAGIFLCVSSWWSPEASVARRLYVILLYVLSVRYVHWRYFETLPSFRWSLECLAPYAFFYLELLSLVLLVRSRRVLAATLDRSRDADRQAGWYRKLPHLPLVDVFVPTYNESWEVLEKTFVGLRLLEYGRARIWILDDGRRDWLRAAATEYGFNYLTRPDQRGYKAGNLNNALAHVGALAERPEFIAIFDADFVPQPRFVERTLALMAEERVGLVQTPQAFYNADPFQYGFLAQASWPDEQRFLFDVRMPSSDANNGAQCCGTSFLLRSAALADIGGRFPTEAICEDTMTSVKLKAVGWQTVYLKERLSAGLNAENLGEFLKQRARWCLGGVQIARWALLSARGLRAKLLWLEMMLKWGYQSFMQMLWLLLPILYWLTGFSLMHASIPEILQYMVPLSLLRGYASWVTRRTQMPVITDSFTLMLAPTVVGATLDGLMPGRKHAFRVTRKGLSQSSIVVYWNRFLFSGAVLSLMLGGMLYRTFFAPLLSASSSNAWNYYATIQQSLVVLIVMLASIERPRRRVDERYPTEQVVQFSGSRGVAAGRLLDLSSAGARLGSREALRVGDELVLSIEGVGSVPARVVRRAGQDEYGLRLEAGAGLGSMREKIIAKIYCSELCLIEGSWRSWPCFVAIARRLYEVLDLAFEHAKASTLWLTPGNRPRRPRDGESGAAPQGT